MTQDHPFNKALIYLIPGISILWCLYLIHLSGPFYLSRIDPEFPYLMNGLNCALLDFSRIGHIDHPGTPFQLLTGFFIGITYLIAGQGAIVDDVISRPEFYLSWATFCLALMSGGVLLWFGKIVYRNKGSLIELLILQSALFIGNVLIDLPSRYIPDRFLEILALVFIGLCYQYFYTKDYSGKKFAIHAGIVMGIGFITKFNFLPLLIIPFIIVTTKKERFIYIGTVIITAFIMFLPVIKEFSYFKGFITSIITHDGLYGGGSEQVFDMQAFWYNALLIFTENIAFTIVLILSLIGMVYLIIKSGRSKRNKKELLFLIANIIAIGLEVIMVSKHYKSYYLIPVVSLTAFVFLISYKLSRDFVKGRSINYIFGLFLMILIVIPTSRILPAYKAKSTQNKNNLLISTFIQNNIPSADYFFIEPTWLYGPLMENGLVYGMSYVAFRHYYYNEFERYYPNLITWEGETNPIRYFRMLDADNEAILKSGKNILILSTPGRHAYKLCNYIDSCSNQYGIRFLQDTIFRNGSTKEYIIRYQQRDNWKTKLNVKFGFEKLNNNLLFSDDGQFNVQGDFERSEQRPANGLYTLKVLPNQQTPEYIFSDVSIGDYLEITIKRKRNKNELMGNLHLYYSIPDSSNVEIASGKWVSHISSYYELIRLTADLPEIPENAILKCCYFNHGNSDEFVDDFTIKQFRND